MTSLMTSGRIGSVELKNRIIMAPMGTHMEDIDRATVEYFMRRADGGAAMLMVNLMVTDYFEDTSSSLVLTEKNVHMFRELCERSHETGARICAQLMPGCGRIGGPAKMYPVPVSASACGWLFAPEIPCHELSLEEIGILLDGSRKTARLAVGAGADAIEIHAYGGYLGDQFLTSAWNTRTDKYGGDINGRTAFLLEMVDISKEEGGRDFPVIVKYCPDHCVPYPGFRTMDEGIEIARILERAGVDALHVDAGCYEKWHVSMPSVYYQEAAPQLRTAKIIRKNVSIPVLTHGRLGNVAKAQAALDMGACDFVAVGRGLLADPDLPNKIKECRSDDILPCISCNDACIGNVVNQKHVACSVNPFTGFETERRILPAKKH